MLKGERRGLRQRVFAYWYQQADLPENPEVVDEFLREIFAGLQGDVVEIGPGTGGNFDYFPEGIRWIGIEPNVYMHPPLQEAMADSGVQGEIRTGTAEHINLPDASVDGVVSTFVLCSVSDLDETLLEILRVLRPGGRFAFMEHVIAPEGTALRFAQRLVKPVWKFVADGCNPDRDIEAAIRRAGFASVQVKSFRVPEFVVSPRVAGVAVK